MKGIFRGYCYYGKEFPMYQKRRNTFIAILEQLLPILLAVVCVLVMTVNTNQAMLAVPFPLNFEGEYSFDDGESWQVLTASSNLSADQGDLLLRGNFGQDLFPGGVLYLYRDHFGVTITVNGQLHSMDIRSEILTLGEAGKPYFADGGPHFSISHTTNHAFCCVSERNIGIDAEEIGRRVDLRLADRFLSPYEKTLFDTAMDKKDCLLRLWVLKESYAKLTGRGVGNYLKSTDFSPDDPRIQIIDGCYVAVLEGENHAF
jgi:hypothetical protein